MEQCPPDAMAMSLKQKDVNVLYSNLYDEIEGGEWNKVAMQLLKDFHQFCTNDS